MTDFQKLQKALEKTKVPEELPRDIVSIFKVISGVFLIKSFPTVPGEKSSCAPGNNPDGLKIFVISSSTPLRTCKADSFWNIFLIASLRE